MASSRKSPATDLAARIAQVLEERVQPERRVAVALSGGIDSVVLLDLLACAVPKHRLHLSALHVNHGISPNAASWERFCRELCRARKVPFKAFRVKVTKGPGISLEAAAREARLRVFANFPADVLALAQHLDDQAETLLLQLLRGAGAKGLAAMPAVRPLTFSDGLSASRLAHAAPCILRPLLGVPRSIIEAYARSRKLRWVEDESNDDTALDRNYLRRRVLPLLAARFPGYRQTFFRTAGHLAEAAGLLEELAAADAVQSVSGNVLHLAVLRGLSQARAKNLLRYFLSENGVAAPSAARLEELLRQLVSATADSRVRVGLGAHEVRCFRGSVYVLRAKARLPEEYVKRWRGEERVVLDPLPGTLRFRDCQDTGISREKLAAQPVSIRLRRGGECLQPDCRRPRRSLKNLLQESAIPPWEREALPLLFCGENLVWVPGIGIDCRYQAQPGESAVTVAWRDFPSALSG